MTDQQTNMPEEPDTAVETLEVPWGRNPARDFAKEFAARIRSGGPAEVTVLARDSTETRWFQELLGLATALCYIRGRGPKTGEHYPTQGQIALYYGRDVEAFTKTWAGRGIVVRVDFSQAAGPMGEPL